MLSHVQFLHYPVRGDQILQLADETPGLHIGPTSSSYLSQHGSPSCPAWEAEILTQVLPAAGILQGLSTARTVHGAYPDLLCCGPAAQAAKSYILVR